MGSLSQTVKTETPFESFYGTDLAGRDMIPSEMREEEVRNPFSTTNLLGDSWPLYYCQFRCLPPMLTATSKMSVSA